jgi:hypothetical protein
MGPQLISLKKPHTAVRRLQRRASALCVVTTALILIAIAAPTRLLAAQGPSPLRPPGNVYTCEWIEAHPLEAAEARVTCDSGTFSGSFFVPLGTPSLGPDATGCNWIPNSGYVGQGVFAWTSYKYTSVWDWYPNPTGTQDYTWYMQTQSATVDFDRENTNDHLLWFNGATNIFRWGSQNHVDAGRRWYVCWDVV